MKTQKHKERNITYFIMMNMWKLCNKRPVGLLFRQQLSFRYLKQGIQEFHRKYVLAPADKAANNVVVV